MTPGQFPVCTLKRPNDRGLTFQVAMNHVLGVEKVESFQYANNVAGDERFR